jgi:hypothetical protein
MIRIFIPIFIALFIFTNAKANDYNTATITHIITETIKGTDIDYKDITNSEIQKKVHKINLNTIDSIFSFLPSIFDGFNTQMRLKADKNYKCSIQGDYKNKECND